MRHLPVVIACFVACVAACKRPSGPPQISVLLHEDGVEYPRLSNDGREILYQSNRGGAWQLYMLDIAAGTSRARPFVSRDGRRVIFNRRRGGAIDILELGPLAS